MIIAGGVKRLENGKKLEQLIVRKQFKIKRLSTDDIRLLTAERLMISNLYRIELVSANNERIKPVAEVIGSFLKKIQKAENDTIPIYEVSLKFIHLNEHEIKFLKDLISELVNREKIVKLPA